MNGIDNIVNRILSDARESAVAVIREARTEADKILADCRKRADAESAAALEASKHSSALITERAEASSETRRRDALLRTRGDLLDECFNKAVDGLAALPTEEYAAFLKKLLIKAITDALDGERRLIEISDPYDKPSPVREYAVRFNRRDRTGVGIAAVNSVRPLLADNGKSIVISDKPADIKGGFMLICGDTNLNCSLEALTRDLRDDLEGAAAAVLFRAE
ncbi:MAG: hypothetical protein GX628_00665 [Clostridiales bacterium]|nr:hypothetical protein [Clostridiales bacterium]